MKTAFLGNMLMLLLQVPTYNDMQIAITVENTL